MKEIPPETAAWMASNLAASANKKPVRLCEFASGIPGACCSNPATVKWGDFFFCQDHAGTRKRKPKEPNTPAPFIDELATFKAHVPALFKEVLKNEGTQILVIPFQIVQGLLARIAARAVEIQDAKTIALCGMLALYEQTDPYGEGFDKEALKIAIRAANKQHAQENAPNENEVVTVEELSARYEEMSARDGVTHTPREAFELALLHLASGRFKLADDGGSNFEVPPWSDFAKPNKQL